ncbi:MAG: class I SAM-dependent methyltransferase [Methanosarcinales archaeon]|nr:class I SAM-dependent methyltransferase [Methanosarcinales archaeon]
MSKGERVTHLYPNDCYYGHLSIYYFALQFNLNSVVLDAGSGAGYGSVYLADHGAKFVWGIDISHKAIKFSEDCFKRSNVKFKVMDIENISGFPTNYFDFIFTSNALEHISDVPAFLRNAWKLLKPEGVMLVAVPPITNEEAIKVDSANPFHLNIWSPRQWYNEFNKYFLEVELYRHGFEKDEIKLDFGNTPAQTCISEKDFIFEQNSLEQFPTDSITAIFILRKPVSENKLPSPNRTITFVDDSFTRSPEISE